MSVNSAAAFRLCRALSVALASMSLVAAAGGCTLIVANQSVPCDDDADCAADQRCGRGLCIDGEREALGNLCADHCGEQLDGCYCDVACLQSGDCCEDFALACGGSEDADQCAGRCGQPAPAGCFCDPGCIDNGDCCPDYVTSCSLTDAGGMPEPEQDAGDPGVDDAGTPATDGGSAGSDDAGATTSATDAGTSGVVDSGAMSVDDAGSTAGTTDGGTTSTGASLFVGQGHMGRLTVSCDDGQTWPVDTSLDDTATCWSAPNEVECDHHVGSATGLVYAEGAFFATFGWGTAGIIQRSYDGVQWDTVRQSVSSPHGVAYGNGVLLTGERYPRRSTDLGTTWEDLGDIGVEAWTCRGVYYFDDLDLFAATFDGEVAFSNNAGDSWYEPTVFPAACSAEAAFQVLSKDSNIVLLYRSGTVCRSTDDGQTFVAGALPALAMYEEPSVALHNGSDFVAWSGSRRFVSSTGETWSAENLTIDGALGPVGFNPSTGTYVAVRGGWQVWYAEQRFYRSVDGLVWETLPSSAFTGLHPMREITTGVVANCP